MNVLDSLTEKIISFIRYRQYKKHIIEEREEEIMEAIEEARKSMLVLRKLLVDVYGRR